MFIGKQLGVYHTCFLSTNATIKCFGRNRYGVLGYGDGIRRGDESEEMGDYLDTVDLGTAFVPTQLAVGAYSNCALSANLTVKCWGTNENGELGVGDTENRGDGAYENGRLSECH